MLTIETSRFAKWKREGLRAFAEGSEMFRGLLNRVRVDLVRTHPNVLSGLQLTESKGQRGRSAKFLRLYVTKF